VLCSHAARAYPGGCPEASLELEYVMNHKRLQSMPTADLKIFARNVGIDFPGNILRDALIEIIADTLDEAAREKSERNNLLVLGEEKKYEISDDVELGAASSPLYPIPEHYHKTEGVLMVRDPNWAFAYWEIAEQRRAELESEPGLLQLVLRVHDVELVDFNGSNSNSYFDIPIQFSDSSWYIYLPHPDCSYLFELGYLNRQGYRILARSNAIRTPRGSRSAPQGPQEPEIHSMEAVYTIASSFDAIPQRISGRIQD
jgi:hypothetical protein